MATRSPIGTGTWNSPPSTLTLCWHCTSCVQCSVFSVQWSCIPSHACCRHSGNYSSNQRLLRNCTHLQPGQVIHSTAMILLQPTTSMYSLCHQLAHIDHRYPLIRDCRGRRVPPLSPCTSHLMHRQIFVPFVRLPSLSKRKTLFHFSLHAELFSPYDLNSRRYPDNEPEIE